MRKNVHQLKNKNLELYTIIFLNSFEFENYFEIRKKPRKIRVLIIE